VNHHPKPPGGLLGPGETPGSSASLERGGAEPHGDVPAAHPGGGGPPTGDDRVSPEVAALDAAYVLPTYARQPLEIVAGEGTELIGRDGRRYLDFVTGLSVNNFGHCHPHIVAAIHGQADRLIHCSNLFFTEPQARLAGRLSSLTNGGKVFFANSGAEANEVAIKVARKRARHLGGGVIVTLVDSFHGRTMATLSATGQPEKQRAFSPVVEGFLHVPAGDVDALRQAFRSRRVAAFMAEPVLGESGVRLMPQRFFDEAQTLCEQHHALVIVDEVQTGLGRCGAPFAYQRFGLRPDIVTAAKSLAGGLPMGAAIVGGQAAGVLGPGDHGSTFGAAPVVAGAALAVLDLLDEPGLFERVEERGAQLESWLQRMVDQGSAREVRRLGLMAAVDLSDGGAKAAVTAALDQGILLNATSDTTLRFLPPLIVSAEEIDRVGAFLLEQGEPR
jgi:acetylornithine/N-succinyldiaminopimelate aminotransferase